jgi:hypothetical protein
MKDGMLVLNMRAPLVGYALHRLPVDRSLKNKLDPKSHHLSLKNLHASYGVDSASLAPGYRSDMSSFS